MTAVCDNCGEVCRYSELVVWHQLVICVSCRREVEKRSPKVATDNVIAYTRGQ